MQNEVFKKLAKTITTVSSFCSRGNTHKADMNLIDHLTFIEDTILKVVEKKERVLKRGEGDIKGALKEINKMKLERKEKAKEEKEIKLEKERQEKILIRKLKQEKVKVHISRGTRMARSEKRQLVDKDQEEDVLNEDDRDMN